MSLLGINLTLLIGPTVAVPAPVQFVEALESTEVTHSDEGRSGFQLTFRAGRSGKMDVLDYPLLSSPLLQPGNRVILIVTFNAMPHVLMDGIITHQQLSPSNEPGASILAVTGEDVSIMMDLEEKSAEHPAQDETIVALKLIAGYARYGLIPVVIPPLIIDPPIPIERIPVQQATDLEHLRAMAARYAYVFYVTPGPAPFTNTAYWGPPKRIDLPQRALSINMGPETNVDTLSFKNNSLSATNVAGKVQDSLTGQSQPVQNIMTTQPPLSSQPALMTQSIVRSRIFRADGGLNIMQAMARAQGQTDASINTVTAEGELDALRYGDLLQARGIVGLRGAGFSYDGLYYVKRVTHIIRNGSYRQRFALAREGLGSITPVVRP